MQVVTKPVTHEILIFIEAHENDTEHKWLLLSKLTGNLSSEKRSRIECELPNLCFVTNEKV